MRVMTDSTGPEKRSRDILTGEIRRWMQEENLDAFIIPSADPHQSEYVPERYRIRAAVSGFTGSAGTVIITTDRAGLWTDSRYFLAAERALAGSEFELFRVHTPGVPDYPQWLATTVKPGARVGVDASLVTSAWRDAIGDSLRGTSITLVPVDDPFDDIWKGRPPLPAEPVVVMEAKYTGEDARVRLRRIRDRLREAGAASHVVITLDDIAWILNLRGSDIDYNPVFLAYLVILRDGGATLYTAIHRVTAPARRALEEAGVSLREYDRFEEDLRTLPSAQLPGPVLLDPQRISWSITTILEDRNPLYQPQPATGMKACKSTTEISRLRSAMIRDGVAMVRFLAWLQKIVDEFQVVDEIKNNESGHTEFTLAEKLRTFRREGKHYVCDSFSYISGLDGNGAIVHYDVTGNDARRLTLPAVYLIDSGAQYRDGTTDITRTVALDPTGGKDLQRRHPHLREDFTLVLKGHIALARLTFPHNTPGREIDAVARIPLWETFRNYGHGTGHGVGFFLNVHEGPQKIAPGASDWPLEAGMLCSNEPGLYRTGRYGIRTENLILVTPAREASEFGSFLQFETLSLCPIDRRLIDPSILNREETEWVDLYHRRVRETLGPHLPEEERRWLEEATAPLLTGEDR
jgi:Xaa-Pro aminopeptidase